MEIENTTNISEFSKGNPLFIKLVLQYTRSAKERQFLRELLAPPIQELCSESTLNLESDPVAIYKRLIQEEELQTGEKSMRKHDVDAKEAFADPAVKSNYLTSKSRMKTRKKKKISITVSRSQMSFTFW